MRLRNLAFIVVITLFGLGVSGNIRAEDTAPAQAANPEIEQRALEILKEMSDYLAAAKTMTYSVKTMVEAPVRGQLVHFWTSSEVTLRRPNGLRLSTKSDYKPTDSYYNGKTLTVYAPKDNMYASIEAPATLDELFPFAEEKTGIHTTYSDLLTSNPFAALTDDITSAFSAGQSNIGGVPCDHLAFKGKDTQWEIWVATGKKPLPVLMTITYMKVPDKPRFIVHFANWKLNAPVAKGTFAFNKPAGATKIAFKPLKPAAEKGGAQK